MIKSSKTSILFSNAEKLNKLSEFAEEYKRVAVQFIDTIWDTDKIPSLLPKDLTNQLKSTTWLSARAVQCCGKQASGIVRGTKEKQRKRLWQINKFIEQGMFKKARKLQKVYDEAKVSKPSINNINPELDSRFVKIDLNSSNKTSMFDGWITLNSIGRKLKLEIPFKKHKHFNKMLSKGILKSGIRLSKHYVTFMFDTEPSKPKTESTNNVRILGIDIGQKTTLACSNNQMIDQDCRGHTYQSICQKLARKKKGSKGFERVQAHRTNYIHWCVNQLLLNDIDQVNIERIRYLRKGKKSKGRILGHWNYAELFGVLEAKLVENGVRINKLSPTYTSQRCSTCGWVRKGNRRGKRFRCDKCCFAADSDLNASVNISLDLREIGKEERLLQNNRKGFYWLEASKEPIVPCAQELNFVVDKNNEIWNYVTKKKF